MLQSFRSKLAAVTGVSMVAAGSAFADVPTAVTDELGTLATDVATVAGLALAAYLVIVTFRYFRRSV